MQSPTGLLPILVGVMSLGLAATSIYAPSLPAIAHALFVPMGTAQQTITAYLAAYGAGMLLVGPLSDRLGRRYLLVGGTALFACASALAAVAPRIEVLMLARALQALGACTGMALTRAIARDVFDHAGTARAMAALSIGNGVTPVIAPVVGGYLQVWWGWRASFVLLAVLAFAVCAAVIKRLPETRRPAEHHPSLLHGVICGMVKLAGERRFVGYALVTAGTTGMFYAYLSAAPVLLISRLGVSPDAFGRDLLMGTSGAVLAAFVSSRTVGRLGIQRLIHIGVVLLVLAALALALPGALALGFATQPLAVVAPLCLVGLAMGLCLPNANAGALSVRPELAGTAAGLAGFMQMVVCGTATSIMAVVDARSALPLGVCWMGSAALAGLGTHLSREPRHNLPVVGTQT